jgi:hypothetical protein
MPNYTSNDQAALLYENSQEFFWNNETVAAGTLSIGWQFRRVLGAFYPWGFAVEVQFSGAPGTFELDIMGAETDVKGNYVKLGSITSVNSSNVGRFDALTFFPKYVAAFMTTLGNAVNTTCKVTR